MNGGAAGGGAGGAIAAMRYNAAIRRWIQKVDGVEYYFVKYPDEPHAFREQPILRISSQTIEAWEESVRRFKRKANLGYVLCIICTVVLLVVFTYFDFRFGIPRRFLPLDVFVTAAVALLIPFVLFLFWLYGPEKAEREVRAKLLEPYGDQYKPDRVWTVLGKRHGDREGRMKNADYLLMSEDEML